MRLKTRYYVFHTKARIFWVWVEQITAEPGHQEHITANVHFCISPRSNKQTTVLPQTGVHDTVKIFPTCWSALVSPCISFTCPWHTETFTIEVCRPSCSIVLFSWTLCWVFFLLKNTVYHALALVEIVIKLIFWFSGSLLYFTMSRGRKICNEYL